MGHGSGDGGEAVVGGRGAGFFPPGSGSGFGFHPDRLCVCLRNLTPPKSFVLKQREKDKDPQSDDEKYI